MSKKKIWAKMRFRGENRIATIQTGNAPSRAPLARPGEIISVGSSLAGDIAYKRFVEYVDTSVGMAVKDGDQWIINGQKMFITNQHKLAEMATKIETARLLTYKAAWTFDQGKIDPTMSSMAKR